MTTLPRWRIISRHFEVAHRIGFGLLIVLSLLAQSAFAQSDLPESLPKSASQLQASPLIGTALEPAVRVAQDLLNAGILMRLRYVDAFAADPVGGLGQGVDNSGVVILGSDFDLNRIIGLPGGQFHVSVAQLYGHELSTDQIGSRTKVQTYYYPYKQFELTEFTYQQSLLNNFLDVIVGRSNATGEFARSTYGCQFENVADCPFEMTQLVGGFPGFPYVNWGGRVRVAPTAETYVKAGAYQLDSVRNRNTGFNWSIDNKSTGFVLPVEAGWENASDGMPKHYKIGGWYNSADYTDPALNTKDRSRGLFGGAPLPISGGRGGIYALGDQVVWRPETGSHRGLALFASAGTPFDTKEAFQFEGLAGFIWSGPFAGRPRDQIGFQTAFLELGGSEFNYLNALLTKAHSNTFVSRSQALIELNYAYEIMSGLVLQPVVQYFINPDDINKTTAKMAPRDALVLGLKLTLNANAMLGLPQQLPGVLRPGTSE
jgi:porin